MFCFLETDTREQKQYEKRIQTSVDNTVINLRYDNKFDNRVKYKNNWYFYKNNIKKNIVFLFLNKNIFYSYRRIFLRFLRI